MKRNLLLCHVRVRKGSKSKRNILHGVLVRVGHSFALRIGVHTESLERLLKYARLGAQTRGL
jgi:hypothetical protein